MHTEQPALLPPARTVALATWEQIAVMTQRTCAATLSLVAWVHMPVRAVAAKAASQKWLGKLYLWSAAQVLLLKCGVINVHKPSNNLPVAEVNYFSD